jgi:hypothetical protein
VPDVVKYMTVVIKCINISCSSKYSAQVLAILTKENTVDYSLIFGYELSVCKMNTLGVWQRKEDQATTASSVIILCLNSVTRFMAFLEMWIFSVCLKKLSVLVFTPEV